MIYGVPEGVVETGFMACDAGDAGATFTLTPFSVSPTLVSCNACSRDLLSWRRRVAMDAEATTRCRTPLRRFATRTWSRTSGDSFSCTVLSMRCKASARLTRSNNCPAGSSSRSDTDLGDSVPLGMASGSQGASQGNEGVMITCRMRTDEAGF